MTTCELQTQEKQDEQQNDSTDAQSDREIVMSSTRHELVFKVWTDPKHVRRSGGDRKASQPGD